MVRWYGSVLAVLLTALFAYALWLRTTSLEGLPDVNGDEVWHAIQLTRLMKGEPYTLLTATNLPLSPLHAGLELPFLFVSPPSLWVVRLPALLTGIAAVVLTYVLGRRMLDRTTALIAAALLAALPVAIIYSRVSYESSHGPLYGILILYFAHRLKTIVVMIMLALSYFIHPTNIFLLPVVLALVWARSREESPEDPARGRRRMWARMAAITGVVLAVGLPTMLRSTTEYMSAYYDTGIRGKHDFFAFWLKYERLFLGMGDQPAPLQTGLVWTVLLLTLSLGLWRLTVRRRWDRVALVAGAILSALASLSWAGRTSSPRGVPVMACSSSPRRPWRSPVSSAPLLVDPDAGRFAWLRRVQVAGILAVGWVLIMSVDLTHVIMWSYMHPDYQDVHESPWTFGADSRPPQRQLCAMIRHDLVRRARSAATLVITEDMWKYAAA